MANEQYSGNVENIVIGIINNQMLGLSMNGAQKARYWQNLEGVLDAGRIDDEARMRVKAYFDANVEANDGI